jgi:hypothetical protein
MKRLALVVVAGAVILGSALSAAAQQPNFAVTFGGQMRVYGLVWDNFTDFSDTDKNKSLCGTQGVASRCKDSESYYFQRWRLYTTVESADKHAKAVWAIEVGDITWGLGGGASGDENGTGVNARNGTSQGGAFGADGANVETKNLYLQFDIPWIPNANILLGAHNTVWLNSPAGAFMDDDGFGIQINLKFDPIDLQLYTVKLDENTRASADDNDFYAARLGVNLTADTRITVEGLVRNDQCFARKGVTPAGNTNFPAPGPCVEESFGDTFWVGATAGTKIAGITLHFTGVYGQRRLWSLANQAKVKEDGFGLQATAQVPIGPLAVWGHAWYTSGDDARIVGGGCEDVTAHPGCTQPVPAGLPKGRDFSTNGGGLGLVQNSDKLPIPDSGASWGGVPFVMEFTRSLALVGAPGFGGTHYSDVTGTWGVGGSASYSLTPAFSVGGGVGFMAATEDVKTCTIRGVTGRCGGGVYGDNIFEVDAGVIWRYNPNLTITGLVGYGIPDEGDDAWGAVFRTQFAF